MEQERDSVILFMSHLSSDMQDKMLDLCGSEDLCFDHLIEFFRMEDKKSQLKEVTTRRTTLHPRGASNTSSSVLVAKGQEFIIGTVCSHCKSLGDSK